MGIFGHNRFMPDRTSKTKDINETAYDTFLRSIGEENPGKNPAAVALGKLGGKKGGPARARKLSATKRRDIAKKAALARWKKRPIP